MRLFLIAHGLRNRSGHHYMEARAFKEEAAKRGLPCTILAHRDVLPEIREELDALPLFRHSPYERPSSRPCIGPMLSFYRHGRSLKKRLMTLPAGAITCSDIVVCTLTNAKELLGLALWLAQHPLDQRPFLAVNFMIDDLSRVRRGAASLSIRRKAALLYRCAFYQLRKALPPNRLLLTAGGNAFAQTMTRILHAPVAVFPLPVQHDLPSVKRDSLPADRPPLIVFPGHMHRRKGADLVGAVVGEVLRQHANCRFLLQANPVSWETVWREEMGPMGKERVLVHQGEMTQEEYQNWMSLADLVLLPYRPKKYLLQTSGVFSEAMALGKVSIVPAGTWMADMAGRYGGGAEVFGAQTVADIVAAIQKALENLPQRTAQMQDISTAWRKNMGMQAFVQEILDAADALDR